MITIITLVLFRFLFRKLYELLETKLSYVFTYLNISVDLNIKKSKYFASTNPVLEDTIEILIEKSFLKL